MGTLRDYFETDFSHFGRCEKGMKLDGPGFSVEFTGRVVFDPMVNCMFVSAYVPSSPDPISVCHAILREHQKILDILHDVTIRARFVGERYMDSAEMVFSRRVLIYCEDELLAQDLTQLLDAGRKTGLSVQFRGPEFARERTAIDKPMAFICHDSRDKESIAKPLAVKLMELMCPVWYDEFSLRVGGGLRESIEKGIRECPKCIVIVSPNFLSNERWAKREYDAAFLREIVEGRKIILPVWCGVTEPQVLEYSPMLAGKFAAVWELGIQEVAWKIRRELVACD